MSLWLTGLVVALAVGIALLASGLKKVPEGHSWTVNRRGRFHRTLSPGWHVVVPLLDRITHRISTIGEVLKVSYKKLRTQDKQRVVVRGQLFLQVLDPRKAASHSGDLHKGAKELTRTCTDELVAQLTLEALQSRTSRELNGWLLGMLNQTSLEWGVRVTRIDLSFTPADAAPETKPEKRP